MSAVLQDLSNACFPWLNPWAGAPCGSGHTWGQLPRTGERAEACSALGMQGGLTHKLQ